MSRYDENERSGVTRKSPFAVAPTVPVSKVPIEAEASDSVAVGRKGYTTGRPRFQVHERPVRSGGEQGNEHQLQRADQLRPVLDARADGEHPDLHR